MSKDRIPAITYFVRTIKHPRIKNPVKLTINYSRKMMIV